MLEIQEPNRELESWFLFIAHGLGDVHPHYSVPDNGRTSHFSYEIDERVVSDSSTHDKCSSHDFLWHSNDNPGTEPHFLKLLL